jgi:hypothetical protein
MKCSRSEDGGIEQERVREADVVQAVTLDEDDLTNNDERRAFHDALSASWESAKAGRLWPASALLNHLRQRR